MINNIYNGTNHDITIYNLDNMNFSSSRFQKGYTLTNPNLNPVLYLEKKNPLNVQYMTVQPLTLGGLSFTFPEVIMNLTMLPDYRSYDAIIVSSKYYEAALRLNYPVEYIDRLYLLSDKVYGQDSNLIGNIGLKKVHCYTPRDYLNAIARGESLSAYSVEISLMYFKNYGLYNEQFIADMNELQRIVEEQNNLSQCQTFNV